MSGLLRRRESNSSGELSCGSCWVTDGVGSLDADSLERYTDATGRLPQVAQHELRWYPQHAIAGTLKRAVPMRVRAR